jgi:hypothetical protein
MFRMGIFIAWRLRVKYPIVSIDSILVVLYTYIYHNDLNFEKSQSVVNGCFTKLRRNLGNAY